MGLTVRVASDGRLGSLQGEGPTAGHVQGEDLDARGADVHAERDHAPGSSDSTRMRGVQASGSKPGGSSGSR